MDGAAGRRDALLFRRRESPAGPLPCSQQTNGCDTPAPARKHTRFDPLCLTDPRVCVCVSLGLWLDVFQMSNQDVVLCFSHPGGTEVATLVRFLAAAFLHEMRQQRA